MGYSVRKRSVKEWRKVLTIKCGECRLEFVLYSVLGEGEDEGISIIEQHRIMYCPYCGAKYDT